MFDEQNIYFTTASIYNWLPLLQKDEFKDILISSLKFLKDNDRLDVFAFVIMPNHLHIIWSENITSVNETSSLHQNNFLKN